MDGNAFSVGKGRYISPSNFGIPIEEGLMTIILALFLLASATSSDTEEIFSIVFRWLLIFFSVNLILLKSYEVFVQVGANMYFCLL